MRTKMELIATAFVLLLALPSSAGVPVEGSLTTPLLEAEGDTTAAGELSILRLRHDTNSAPLASPQFSLQASHLTIENDHADHYIQRTRLLTQPETTTIYDGGPATLTGLSNRVSNRLWIIPLEGSALPVVEVHAPGAQFSPPRLDELVLVPHVKPDRGNTVTPTRDHAVWSGSKEVHATLQGDFLMVAWEWDARLETDSDEWTVRSGVQGPAAEHRAGSADEVWITAIDATLSIPLRPDTYELYLDAPRIHANGTINFPNAQGSLSSTKEPLRGDVKLLGNLVADVDPQGVDRPLRVQVSGEVDGASVNGASVAIQAPATPGSSALDATLWSFFAGLCVLAGLRYARPYRLGAFRYTSHGDTSPTGLRERVSAGWWLLAASAKRRGRTRLAERRAKRSLYWNPDNVNAVFVLAGCSADKGDLKGAKDLYRVVAETAKKSRWRATAVVGEAEVLARQGRSELAEEYLFWALDEDAAWAARAVRTAFWDSFPGKSTVVLLRQGVRPPPKQGYA